MSKNDYTPDYAVHPGEILLETLGCRKMDKSELAEKSGLSLDRIELILD